MDPKSKDILRIGIIGLGGRGQGILSILLTMDDVAITAVCDRYADRAEKAAAKVVEKGQPEPFLTLDYKEVVRRDDVDCIITPSSWTSHTEIMLASMEAGKPVGTEVGGATSVEECWELVRTWKRTGVPCMMLENCCYGREEMAILNMVRQGLFGELIHCQGGYEHDLRDEVALGLDQRHYRFRNYLHRTGDNYPTHALGPLAKMLNINRGNRFISLASFASKTRGIKAWAEANLAPDHPARQANFVQADVVSTILTCAHGETVLLTLDTSLPRPYSRGQRVQGTKGIWMELNDSIYLEGQSPPHEWESFRDYIDEHDHPLWQDDRISGFLGYHGGMDYLILRAFIEPLLAGQKTLPIDVYDTVTWMAVTALSEESVALGGQPVPFPDFTRGAWIEREAPAASPYSLD